MRGFHDSAFLDLLQEVERATAPSPAVDRWEHDGVLWVRERHLYWGQAYSFQIQAHHLTSQATRGAWALLVVVEMWWGQSRTEAIRTTHWGRLESGQKEDALRWLETARSLHRSRAVR